MFIALEEAEFPAPGIFGGILKILTRPKARIEVREALGAVYGVIVAPRPRRLPDWRRIEYLADRYADTMLLPEGLKPPAPISEARFPRFDRLLLLNTAAEIINRTRLPMYRRVAGLVDTNGAYADFLYPLLHHYTTLKVLTKETELYSSQAERMMHELGAPVVICEDYSAFSGCVLVIAPDGISQAARLKCPVLCQRPPEVPQHSDFITDLTVVPSPEIADLCPKGIEPHNFLAALYEYCGVESIKPVAENVIWRYGKSGLEQVARAVIQSADAKEKIYVENARN